jgi:hypothetical protein
MMGPTTTERLMPSAVRSFAASLALLAAVACASTPKAVGDDNDPAQGAVQPPVMITSGVRPELRVPPPTSGRIVVARMDIQVMVDATGIPDMSTFRATGPGSELNQDALRTWIAASSFRPARRDGLAVPGLFRTILEGRRR